MLGFKSVLLVLAGLLLATPSNAYSEREGLDIYQRGLYEEAIAYWKKAAAAGDVGSAYRLSEEYFDAKIVKRNIGLALRYLMQAAEGNDPRALTDLASLYDNGWGVRRNRDKAAKLYMRAARQGMPAAMFNIASFLELGEGGLRQDRVEAYKFYLLSSDLGFAPFAQPALAELGAQMSPDELVEAEKRAAEFIPVPQ